MSIFLKVTYLFIYVGVLGPLVAACRISVVAHRL